MLMMGLVFQGLVLGDVHAAIVAGRGLAETGIAVQGTAVEELFQARLVRRRQGAGIFREVELVAAAVAAAGQPGVEDRREMIVYPAADLAAAVAQRARHAHLRRD